MVNPSRQINGIRQPQIFNDGNWFPINPPCRGGPGGNDWCGVHFNSGVMNKWFHTLCTGQGPLGRATPAIAFDDALNIVYDAQRYYLTRFSNYQDAAMATKLAARSLYYGECSPQQRAVIAAWDAVEVPVPRCEQICDFQVSVTGPSSAACGATVTLNASCNSPNNVGCSTWNSIFTYGVYDQGGILINDGNTGPSRNVTLYNIPYPNTFRVFLNKSTTSYCFTPSTTITINGNCGFGCDAIDANPVRIGTWNGYEVQIRSLPGGKRVLVTLEDTGRDRFFPRGDNFWPHITRDANTDQYQACLNAGETPWWGLSMPGGLTPPAGYVQGQRPDGAIYFEQGNNPCDIPNGQAHLGTWNGLNVQIRQQGGLRYLVTAEVGSSNDRHFARGNNFWDNFTKDPNIPQSTLEQWRNCLNVGETSWWGLTKPGSVGPPPGYQQGTTHDGAVFFSTNGLRRAAEEPTTEPITLVQVMPNPTADELRVVFQAKAGDAVTVRLHSAMGNVLKTNQLTAVDGQNEHTLRLGTLPTGVYVVETLIQGQRIVHKVLKE
jgi:bacillolysin